MGQVARPSLRRVEILGFALLAYLPFFLSSPGKVSADTKQYLYLDPSRLLSRAPYLWDAHVGMGTVPHQNIGYLFPMGPYYWLMEQLGMPDWVAQRIWLGSISFAAGIGVLWLFRMLGISRAGAIAGALVYMLTPYQLALTARLSVILLPWAALPWLVGLTARALERRGWRDPAIFALVALAAGSVSAPSLLLVGIAPVLYLVVAVLNKRATGRDALTTAARIGALAAGVSLWWAVGLATQARYGIPVLDVTESLKTVASASNPPDLLRGLGNWFLSGADRVGRWLDQAEQYGSSWLAVVTFAIPGLALIAAALTRWRHRAYFIALVVVGTVVGVGAWPFDHPSPLGSLFKDLASGSALGLALRNTPRVVPVIVLGIAGLLAAGVSALAVRRRLEVVAAAVVSVLVVIAFVPVWQHGYLSRHLHRSEDVPTYWKDAAAALDAGGNDTRVLEIPGSLFAAYRWGNTVDPITPGLIDRPWVARELLPFGSRASVNLLAALDRRIQEGTFEPETLAVIARLMRAGTIVVRSDLEYERYETPNPKLFWVSLTDPLAPGLHTPKEFGPSAPNRADPTLTDADNEARADTLPDPPEVAVIAVDGAPNIVSTASPRDPVVLAGDGEGIVDAAAAGLLEGRELVLYDATLDDAGLHTALDQGADLVLTDTNRRRARRWGALQDNHGFTERAHQQALRDDTDDYRLDPFPDSSDATRTVAEHRGGTVDATNYGFTGEYLPEDRPTQAFDGDDRTAWRAAGGEDAAGERLVLRPDRAVRTDRVTLVQPLNEPNARWLTSVRLHFDRGEPITVDLNDSSRTPRGQVVRFPKRTVHRLEIELLSTTSDSADQVGFAEVRLGDVQVDEVVRLPTSLLDRAGAASLDHRLVIVMSRLRSERSDEEIAIVRRFKLPTDRAFSFVGSGRVQDSAAPIDATQCIDDLVTVDGDAVSIQVVGQDDTGVIRFEQCDQPIELRQGSHVVRTRPGLDTGIDIDRLVLTSAPGGEAASDAAARLGASSTGSGESVHVVNEGMTAFDVQVRTDGRPFWLVLGQSLNDGWQAKLGDGTSLGEPQLVDGYANGWLVRPDEPGTLSISLRWTPQRFVWIGLAISALAVLGCLMLVWRTRKRTPSSALAADVHLDLSLARAGPSPETRIAALAAVATGIAAGIVTRPWIGALTAIASFAALRTPRGRVVLLVGAPVALVLAKVSGELELGWITVALLGADLVCSWVVGGQSDESAMSDTNASRSVGDGTPHAGS